MWPVSTFARHEGKVGKITMRPDGDGDVRLAWADGSERSGYIKAVTLTMATRVEWDSAVRWSNVHESHGSLCRPALSLNSVCLCNTAARCVLVVRSAVYPSRW